MTYHGDHRDSEHRGGITLGEWAIAILVALMLWAVICMSAAAAFAETGLDILALAKHDAGMIAQEIDNGTVVGYLDSTFGNPYPNLQRLADSGKMSGYRVHLRDFTCYRGSRCSSGYPRATDTKPISDAATRLASFVNHNSKIPCFVSPALEHDVKDRKVVEKWYEILRRIVPNCTPVCSSFTGVCPNNVLIEKHGNVGNADIRSNDGDSLFDSNSSTFRTSGRVLSLGWWPEANCRVSGEKPGEFIPPKQRTNCSTRVLVRAAVRLMRVPEPRKAITNCPLISSPSLWKTHAEEYLNDADSGRGNKPLLISKQKVSRVSVQTSAGKEIGCLKFFGSFDGGGFRYYSGTCDGKTAIRYQDEAGSEWGRLKIGNACTQINFIRRLPYFH